MLEVKVPVGVRTGSRIRVAGEGERVVGGGPAGDLWLSVTVLLHDIFERNNDDLRVEVPVALWDALLGAEIEVPTLGGGKLALKVPAETQNGQIFRLRDHGMPALGGRRRGDLFSKLKVVLPTNLTPGEREQLEQMKAHRAKTSASTAA